MRAATARFCILPISDWIDLRGAIISSTAWVETGNLGAIAGNASYFVVEGAREPASAALIEVTKSVAPNGSVLPGSLLTYTVEIRNTSDLTVTQVVVTDTLSLALTPAAIGTAVYDAAGRALVWDVGSLLPESSVWLTFTAWLTDDAAVLAGLDGYITNQAVLTSSLESAASNVVGMRAEYRLFLPVMAKNATFVPVVTTDAPLELPKSRARCALKK